MVQIVTNSELGTFRSCRQLWWFRYHEGLRPIVGAPAMHWGTAAHAGLEEAYAAAFVVPDDERLEVALDAVPEAVDNAVRQYQRELSEAVDLGSVEPHVFERRLQECEEIRVQATWGVRHMLEATAQDFYQLQPLLIEHPLELPVPRADGRPGALRMAGKVDAVWWDQAHGRVVVDDHKSTTKNLELMEGQLAIDPQMSGYLALVKQLVRAGKIVGVPADAQVGAVRYNCIRRGHPTRPHVNKVRKNDGMHAVTAALAEQQKATGEARGLVSAAQVDTTPEIYREALERQLRDRKLPVTEEQQARLRALEARGDTWFRRWELWRGEEELERWRREVWAEARLLRQAAREPSMCTRNTGHCTGPAARGCAYKAVCMQDVPETRALYRLAAERHEELVEDQAGAVPAGGADGEGQEER